MRTKNSLRNIKYNLIVQILNLVFQFINRTLFIRVLGNEYLGINGLFSNILTLLSLADLGIGTVLTYSLYKPLEEKDETKLKKLMNYYKKIYVTIGLVIFVIGMAIIPFLPKLIKEMPNVPNLNLIYCLYLLNSVASYFCIYKFTIISADQKNYIVSMTQQFFSIIASIVMIIILFCTKNFILYLITQIFFSIFSNLYLSKKAEKMYPFIKDCGGCQLDNTEKKEIKKNTFALFLNKIGSVVVSGTDNLVISSFVGINAVGLYSNYLLIINSINKFTGQYFNSLYASVGNLNSSEDNKKIYDIFKKIFFGNFGIYTFCSVCLYCLFNPFITIWLGKEYVFHDIIVGTIVLSFYIDGMRKSVLMFRESMGLFTNDQFKPIVESILNIVLSIVLTIRFGIVGVFLGTIISMLVSCVFVESYILFKHGFKEKYTKFLKLYFKYIVIGILVLVISLFINNVIIINNQLLEFFVKLMITVIVNILLICLFVYKTDEFKYFSNMFGTLLKHFKKL